MELLKRDFSLTLLKVRLLDADASSAPASSADSAANHTLTAKQRIFCELQVTGDAAERGLVAPTAQATSRAPSRRRTSSRPVYEDFADDAGTLTRTLAQWSFAAEEMQLPVQYSEAARFRDRPTAARGWLADKARFAVSRLLNDSHADKLERLASTAAWLPSGKPTLPSTITRQLRSLLPSVMRESDCLWLELAEPLGYLPLLPWEELLRSVTGAPILRLSAHAVKALSKDRELSVVLFVTAPSDKWTPTAQQVESMARAIRDALPERSILHVFADDLCHAPFVAAKEQLSADDAQGRVIKVYDPALKAIDTDSANDSWTAWIAESLSHRAADIVHCVAPGLLFADHARLAIARDPISTEHSRGSTNKAPQTGGRLLRYVTPLELCESLTFLGAWGAVFSTPAHGSWLPEARMGLRMLVDQLARLRPGVVAFHDLETDAECKALAETYKFMIGDPSIRASSSTAVSVYCHPGRAVRAASELSTLPGDLLSQYLKVTETIQTALDRGGPLPAWIAATQRIVEQAVSRVAGDDVKQVDDAALRGLASALKYVEQMVADQMHAGASPESTSPPAKD